jgi:hypothetical protein
MKLNTMFPRKYATGADLNGQTVNVTIESLSVEKLSPHPGQPPMDRFVLYFKNAQKGVILSRTLAEQIASILQSDDTDEWINRTISLYPQQMNVAGKSRIAIRAKKAAQV